MFWKIFIWDKCILSIQIYSPLVLSLTSHLFVVFLGNDKHLLCLLREGRENSTMQWRTLPVHLIWLRNPNVKVWTSDPPTSRYFKHSPSTSCFVLISAASVQYPIHCHTVTLKCPGLRISNIWNINLYSKLHVHTTPTFHLIVHLMQSLKLIGMTKWLWFTVHLYEILFFQN